MNPDWSLEKATRLSGGAGPPAAGANVADLNDTDSARADEYALLGSLLLRAPDAEFLVQLAGLQGAATPLGLAHVALGRTAASTSAEMAKREYFNLFIGVGRGELLPYASYYLTGFLNERPLARLREDMKRLGLDRAEGHSDPEDHLGTLCEIMNGFASNRFGIAEDDEHDFFTRHIASWAGRFFADLETAQSARVYRALGAVGRIFIDIETEGFAMEAGRRG